MEKRLMHRFSCAALLLGLAGCAAETSAAVDEQVEGDLVSQELVLAEAPIAGGKARFLAVDADTVLVTTDTVGVEDPMRDPALHGLTIVQAYEYWSGEAAPAALVARAGELLLAVPNRGGQALDRAPVDGVAPAAAALSAAEFSGFCNSTTDFCWLDRSGTWEYEHSSRYFIGTGDAVRGDVTVQMRRWEVFGRWTQLWKTPVPQGHLVSMSASSGAVFGRPLKFKIFDADGDHWHVALDWY
jgi:hypothetical protein